MGIRNILVKGGTRLLDYLSNDKNVFLIYALIKQVITGLDRRKTYAGKRMCI